MGKAYAGGPGLASHALAEAAHDLFGGRIKHRRGAASDAQAMARSAVRGLVKPPMLAAFSMKTVLAPVDFSPATQVVVREATALARALGARLVLFHAVAPAFVRTSQAADRSIESSYLLQAEKQVMAELAKWQYRLRDQGVTAHTVHRIGPAGLQILEQAERLEADYIVMGSHGHGALYDLLVGSTTMRVLKAAKCGVVVIPVGVASAERTRSPRRGRASNASGEALAAGTHR